MRLFNASGPLSDENADQLDPQVVVLSEDCVYSLKLFKIKAVLEDLALFILNKVEVSVADVSTVLEKALFF